MQLPNEFLLTYHDLRFRASRRNECAIYLHDLLVGYVLRLEPHCSGRPAVSYRLHLLPDLLSPYRVGRRRYIRLTAALLLYDRL